jgi:hypothetical protein
MLHPQPPVLVEVRDAETREPIAGAQVRVWHAAIHSVTSSGTTGPDGLAQIPAPPADDTPLIYEFMAKGYMARQMDHPLKRVQGGVTLELFAEPRPTLELVVANGYRGVVRAKIRVQDDLTYPPHQRLFSYPVPASAFVEAVVPPLFARGSTPDLRVRYAEGTPLSRDAKPYEVGCRWLKSDPDSEYVFLIGTQWEADTFRRNVNSTGGEIHAIGQESLTGFGRGK